MTKLYFGDPLAAAYMAREFGVKFQYWHSGRPVIYPDKTEIIDEGFRDIPEGWHTSLNDILGGGMYLGRDRLYIHPDSQKIFHRQSGDVVKSGDDVNKIYICPQSKALYKWGTDVNWCPLANAEIIQRDGKAFFTPEVVLCD